MKDNEITRDDSLPEDCAKPLFDSKFIHVYDLQYAEGRHYYDVSRRGAAHLMAVHTADDMKAYGPDAVSCTLILRTPGEEPRLYLQYEFRYPAGQYLLSVPAGLIDPEDRASGDPVRAAAVREIHEETGITVKSTDRTFTINPLAFSTPGMTDECNGLFCAVVDLPDLGSLNHKGAIGPEKFSGYRLLTEKEARDLIRRGTDERGMYYPIYTLVSLLYFVSGMWKK